MGLEAHAADSKLGCLPRLLAPEDVTNICLLLLANEEFEETFTS